MKKPATGRSRAMQGSRLLRDQLLRTPRPQFELEACLQGISTVHVHGVEREPVQVFANQIQLLQDALLQHSVQSSDRLAQIGELILASPFLTHGVAVARVLFLRASAGWSSI